MKNRLKLSTMQILVIGFMLVILAGAVLLALPVSNRDGQGIPFINALFTATSATCVTGLIVYDTYTQFTLFGQVVILALIQLGGLGFMIVAIMFSLFIGRRIGLRERSLLMESVSAPKLGGVVRLAKRALTVTVVTELLGAVILAFRFVPLFGFWKGIWCGLFHAVSAFCNAGFDIMGRLEPYSSLTHFYNDPFVVVTIGVLIIFGGLGFFVWDDISGKKLRISKYHLHTKLMLSGTLALLVAGTVLFYILEKNASMQGMTAWERLLSAFFAAVTPRTAGYNSVVLPEMSEGGTLLTTALMIIGAGPGSTGGGLKVTTIIVILLGIAARVRNSEDLNVFGRRLENDFLQKAATSAGIYFLLLFTGGMILCAQGFMLEDALYEVASALGTVGLTRGITPALPVLSRMTIILLMFAGRVGSLAVVMAMSGKNEASRPRIKQVTEKIIIG